MVPDTRQCYKRNSLALSTNKMRILPRARAPMRLAAKDYVTAGNLLAGFAAAILGVQGRIFDAFLMFLAALIFDLSDGVIARLTRTQNSFGSSFDNVCDHMSWGIAPGFILFGAYHPVFKGLWGDGPLAAAVTFSIASIPVLGASLRFARFNTYSYDTPGIWLGFPRPASAFAFVALVNSHFFEIGTELQLATIPLLVFFGVLNVSTFPYPSHHHKGATPYFLWVYYGIFVSVFVGLLVCSVVVPLVPRALAGDFAFLSMVCYALFSWSQIPKEDRIAARKQVEEAEASQ